MIRQMVKLAVEAFLVELEKWADPTPPSASVPKPIAKTVVSADEKSAPWNMVQEVAPAPERRRRKAAAS